MKFKLIFNLLVVLFFFSCKNDSRVEENKIVASFTVDYSLLEDKPYTNKDYNFIINVPKNWNAASSDDSEDRDSLIYFVDSYNTHQLAKFEEMEGEGFMTMNIWNERMIKVTEVDSLMGHFRSLDYWLEVQHSNFSHDCFDIDQFVLQNANHVCFKLVCNNSEENKKFEITYVVERKKMATIVKSIESSIGSLNCII